MMTDLWKDLRYALRTLRRAPGFTAVAVATLAIGIGANTGIFSLVNAALLRDLPYPNADQLARVYLTTDRGKSTASPPDFADWRAQGDLFSGMAAYHTRAYALTGEGEAEQILAAQVTGDFFSVLGVPLAQGRPIGEADAMPGAEKVVVLGDALWQSRFGGEPGVIGERILLDGVPHTVIGIAAPAFAYPRSVRLWTARSFSAEEMATQRGAHYLEVIARLEPGVTTEQASTQIARIAESLARQFPTTNRETSATVTDLRDALVGNAQESLLILLGAVTLVLLIACANVANLLVARALGRRRDLALRHALGASRLRLARLVLVESLVLALLGGGLGVFLAAWGTPLLARLRPDDALLQAATIDSRVLVVTLVVSMLTGLLFGIFPALRLVPAKGLAGELVSGGRGSSATAEAHLARRALAIAEVAIAFILLVGAGLLMRSFVAMRQTDVGFATASRLTFIASAPEATYDTPQKTDEFFRRVTEQVRAIPGAETVGATMILPLSGDSYSITAHSIDGRELPEEDKDRLATQIRVVRDDFFSAMGMAVLEGRPFTQADRAGAPDAVVLNASAARLLFPNGSPLGHEVRIGTSFGLGGARGGGTVVGVVGDTRDFGVQESARPVLYLSHPQFPVDGLEYVIVTSGAPEAMAKSVRAAVAAVDPNVPVYGVKSMEAMFNESVARPRFMTTLLLMFALIALLLASVGLYGVIAYGVGERSREFGIRMALGAGQRDVMAMVMRSGWSLGLKGLALGIAGALAASTLLRSQLYGVRTTDLATMIIATLVLLPVALLATYIPARRATGVDPGTAIRAE
jgi:predicted permease